MPAVHENVVSIFRSLVRPYIFDIFMALRLYHSES
jgi:hypothetical protein